MPARPAAEPAQAEVLRLDARPVAPAIPGLERSIAGALLVALMALRVLYVFHREFDSDEPQHLHVVWAWTRGLLPYRDVLDNHAPLFHLLMSPLLRAIGERPEALHLMRFAMFPLFGIVLATTAWIGRRLFPPRAALWGTVLAAAWPQHFLTSLEFRADDLWAALWLLALGTLLCGPATRARMLLSGLLAGAALATSLKTGLLILGLVLAIAWVAARDPNRRRTALRSLGPWLAGAAVMPVLAIALFAFRGALPEMFRAVVTGNALQGLWSGSRLRVLLFPLGVPVAIVIARVLAGHGPGAARRTVLFLSGALTWLAMVSFWPLVTPQNDLPVQPLAALCIAALLIGGRPETSRARIGALATAGLALAAGAWLLLNWPPWHDRTGPQRALIADVLALTGRDETVMDLKGESVFRRRPVFWVLESVTQERFRRGLLRDDVSDALRAHHTAVAAPDHHRLPIGIRTFLNANYISVGAVRVLGQRLGRSWEAEVHHTPAAPGGMPAATTTTTAPAIGFDVVLPERYAILAGSARARGALDGVAPPGARWLEAGHHQYVPAAGEHDWTLIWARALENGYAPPPRMPRPQESR